MSSLCNNPEEPTDNEASSSLIRVSIPFFIPDLGSLSQQLLLQSQPLLLDLLQSHLVVSSHDSTVGRRQRPSLLHWSTLGDPLLVQGCGRRKKVKICKFN